MESPRIIDHLPDEMLVEIFSHLSLEDLVHSTQHVALRWREISHDAHLWRDLVYNPSWEVRDDEILKVIQQAPKLETLLLEQRGVGSRILLAFIQNCKDLKKLKFNSFQRFSSLSIRNLVHNCENIVELDIPDRILSEIKLSQFISQLQHLKILIVGGWGNEKYRLVLKPLADGCPALQHVDIRYKQYSTSDLEYFLNKKQNQLQSLKVNWSGEQGKCVPPALSVCKSLKTLHLDNYCDIDSDAAFESLQTLKSVTVLCLSSLQNAYIHRVMNLFNGRSFSQLVDLKFDSYENYEDRLADVIVKNCPLLKVLFFRECFALTDRSLQNLHILKELQHLNLRNCGHITDIGMGFLCKCKHLKRLNLSCCYDATEDCWKKVTDLSSTLEILKLNYSKINGLEISKIPSCLPNLSLLSVDYCEGLDHDALEELKTAMPQLTVNDRVDEYANNEGNEEGEEDGAEEGEQEEEVHNEQNYIPVEPEEPDILYDDAPFLFEQLLRF